MLADNALFTLEKKAHPRDANIALLYFTFKPVHEKHADSTTLLSNALREICDNPHRKSSVVLDALALSQCELLGQFVEMAFGSLRSVTNTGLDKFIILSHSGLLVTMSKTIIKLKKAASYTHICASVEEAMRLL
jgi:hypothetical protein